MSSSISTTHRRSLRSCGLTSMFAIGLVIGSGYVALSNEVYPHAGEPIGRVEQVYDGALTPDMAVNTFRNIDRLFPSRTIKAGASPSDLPKADRQLDNVVAEIKGIKYDIYDYLALNNVTGFLVLKDGKIVYETYQRGNTPK